MTKNIITIDGPAASGKGTLARKVADHFDYFYLDTGKIYRLIGLQAHQADLIPEDNPDDVAIMAKTLSQNFDLTMMDNPELKSDLAGQMASRVGQFQHVRDAILDLQRHLAVHPPANKKGAVLDGRDCGTVICPEAPYKFFVTADQGIRAKRRFDELKSRGDDIDFETVLNDMKERDDRDFNRSVVPTKPADDAVIIDTTDMSIDQAFSKMISDIA
jgi:cytidylate kinase